MTTSFSDTNFNDSNPLSFLLILVRFFPSISFDLKSSTVKR